MLRLSVGRQHPDVPTALFLLSKLAEEGGRLDEALQRMKECVEIREAVLEPDHSDLLISRARLGTLMAEQGDVPGGRKLLESVLERRVRRFGGDHNDVATTHNSLANICVKAGEMQSAQTHYSEALRVRELAGGGVASKAIAIDLCNLAWVQGRNGEALEAERNARRGVAMHEQVGTTSESIASAWWVLGEVLLRAGNLPEAEMYTRKAMEHASESARTGTSRLSYTRQLARILVAASRHDEAVVLLTTCLSDYKPENLGTVKSARDAAGDLVNLLQSRGEPEAAEIVRQQWGIKGSK
jgi:tetratricopeptide (TPR) repeat protein